MWWRGSREPRRSARLWRRRKGSWRLETKLNIQNTHMKKRLISGAVILSLVAGCAVGPKYRKPIVESPSTFRGAGDEAAASVNNSPASLADLKWVEVFKDEQLQDLI